MISYEVQKKQMYNIIFSSSLTTILRPRWRQVLLVLL